MCVHVHVCTRARRDQCLHLVFLLSTLVFWDSLSLKLKITHLAKSIGQQALAPPHPLPSQHQDYRLKWLLIYVDAGDPNSDPHPCKYFTKSVTSPIFMCRFFLFLFFGGGVGRGGDGVLCSSGWPLTACKAQDWPWNHMYAPPPQLCWDLNSADSCRLGKQSSQAVSSPTASSHTS